MTTTEAGDRLRRLTEEILEATWQMYPNLAAREGLHQYDGRLPDLSPQALEERRAQVGDFLAQLSQMTHSSLSPVERLDLRLLRAALERELFELTELQSLRRDPMEAMWHIEFSFYISREYAPLPRRAEALCRALEGVPRFLETVSSHLRPDIGRPVLEASVEAYQGLARFYREDVLRATEGLEDRTLRGRLERATAGAADAVEGFVADLRGRMERAPQTFALGPRLFLRLLEVGELVSLPLERLEAIGQADLRRNLERFRRTAAGIDPHRSPAEVMARVAQDHPSAENLIPETAALLEEIREFIIRRGIVTVPSEERCQTTETPSFMRWAFAAMDTPGPFENKATEAYYYVTPVDPSWSDEQKEQWLTSFNYPTLQNISIHEAYPGHYVHYLHSRGAPSVVSRVFGSYSCVEGWAHYTEEMMVDQGWGEGDPRARLAQLAEALVRDCRFLCAIGMHTRGMTVEEATLFFMENAFMEELPARREAMRGTFDPLYLSYTLGKLMILKLREDYRRQQGDAFSLRRFHDAFLSYGAPPIPLLRRLLLGEDADDVL